jgi:hypothetical protein
LLTLPAMTLSCSLPYPSGTLIPSPGHVAAFARAIMLFHSKGA